MGKALSCGSGGVNIDFVTAGAAQILAGYTGADVDGEPVLGSISTRNDSGNVTLSTATGAQSKSYAAGHYPNAHGAAISLEEKLGTNNNGIVPTTGTQDITPSSGKVLSKVRIGAIPNQKSDSGNVTLSTATGAQSKSYAAGYYGNAHGAQIALEEKLGTNNNGITPTTSYQDITPTDGKVLSKVRIGAIPNQKSDSGNVTLTSASATKSYAAGYYANAHGATVPVYTGG